MPIDQIQKWPNFFYVLFVSFRDIKTIRGIYMFYTYKNLSRKQNVLFYDPFRILMVIKMAYANNDRNIFVILGPSPSEIYGFKSVFLILSDLLWTLEKNHYLILMVGMTSIDLDIVEIFDAVPTLERLQLSSA